MDAGVLENGDLAQGREDLRGRMGDGFLPQPAQRCLPRRRVGLLEPDAKGLPLVAEQRRQAAKGLVVGLLACRRNQALQARHARPDDLFAVEFFARQLQQQSGLVMFEGALEQPGLQAVEIKGRGTPKPQVSLYVALVIRLRPVPLGVGNQTAWVNRELFGYERDHLMGNGLEGLRHESEIAEAAQLQGITKTIVGRSLAPDLALVILRQQEEGMEVVLWNGARKALPAFLLGVAEKVDRHARALLRASLIGL